MSEPFGPFREGLGESERIAQLRVLRTLVHLHAPSGDCERALLRAEGEIGANAIAMLLFDALPALTRRRILATFAYVHRPMYNPRRKQPKKGTAYGQVA